MLDVSLLGTGGMMPLPYRWLTALMLRYNGKSILIDCGEGTQIALREIGWSPKPIDIICFTHFHADHISGLPGMLLTMGNAERTEPLMLIGPKGLTRTVNALRSIAPELPFEVECVEIAENEQEFTFDGFRIKAFKVNHKVTCYGYSLILDRAGKFDVDKAKALGLPVQYWGMLQKGESVIYEGKEYNSSQVMGASRKGLKVTYCTDTRPMDIIIKQAEDADLFICEGMYGEDDKLENAKENKHMTMMEAAGLAMKANPKELWLTHYSPATARPQEFEDKVREIFPRTVMSKDRRTIELKFED
ncbi:MAG: ribonuclease Z [Lachnospiraceae bacterium]|nr:ribonuclease Z [Lachnospiraceae bacterium]